jgi:hypothetical protein
VRKRLRRLICFILDHIDEVTDVRPHPFNCQCRGGGGHGDVDYKCKRCGRKETHRELIC